MNTKVCTGPCGRELTIDNFHKQRKGKFGVTSECKECRNKKNNPPNTDINIKQTCTGECGKEKPATLEYFHRNKKSKFGVQTECKECMNKTDRERNNPVNTDASIKQVCTGDCGRELPATTEFFYKKNSGKFGVRTECKECCNKRKKEKNNPVNTDVSIKQVCTGDCGEEFPATLEYFYRSKCDKFGVQTECKECRKQRKKNDRDKIREYEKKRYHNNEQYRIRAVLSSNLRHALNKIGQSKNASILQYIGCDVAFLQQHLNNTKDDNWGDVELHIDHIIPVSSYDHTNKEEIKKCWNWRNLRYLPGPENSSKGDILDMALVEKYGISDLLPDFLRGRYARFSKN